MTKYTFRGSQIGTCPRALTADILQPVDESLTPEYLKRAAREGEYHERIAISRLMNAEVSVPEHGTVKWQVTDSQFEVAYDSNRFEIIGHIDGLAWPVKRKHDSHLLEIKSMSRFEFDRWMREGWQGFPKYREQISFYMERVATPECIYFVRNRDSGYEDIQLLTKPPSDFDAIIAGLDNICDYLDRGELASAYYEPGSTECKRCQHKLLCIPAPSKLEGIKKAEIADAIADLREGKKLQEQADELIGPARAVLEAYTRDEPEKKLQFDGMVCSIVSGKRKNIDKVLMREFLSDEALKMVETEISYEQFRATDSKPSE